MGTEVLRPQDCLTFTNHHHRIRITPVNVFHRRKTHYHGNGIPKINGYRKQPVLSDRFPAQRNQSPEPIMISKRSASTGDLSKKRRHYNNKLNYRIATNTSNDSLVSGSVAILRRRESLESKIEPIELGITDIYAGSAFSMSPSPRALPLPSFFNSNNNKMKGGEKCVDDLATRDLRRLLRLE